MTLQFISTHEKLQAPIYLFTLAYLSQNLLIHNYVRSWSYFKNLFFNVAIPRSSANPLVVFTTHSQYHPHKLFKFKDQDQWKIKIRT